MDETLKKQVINKLLDNELIEETMRKILFVLITYQDHKVKS